MAPLLMIPGPVECSPLVREAFGGSPPSHLSPPVIEAFGSALEHMRRVWKAPEGAQPFILAGSGTLFMDSAAGNLVDPKDRVLVINTGYFSDRTVETLRRRGAEITEVAAEPGDCPDADMIASALEEMAKAGPIKAIFATHVDTSTGVRLDPEAVCALGRKYDALTVFDGVCATGAEAFDMAQLGADLYFTASQKAIGAPVGLALGVASPRALRAREALSVEPSIYVDWQSWLPIMRAYEAREPSYFATPATNHVLALAVALREILEDTFAGAQGIDARVRRHAQTAQAMREAFRRLGLETLGRELLAANTLSALRYPEGVGPELLREIHQRGVTVAGGLYPGLQGIYFRVGHMGYCTTQPNMLSATVTAIGESLAALGRPGDLPAALEVVNQR